MIDKRDFVEVGRKRELRTASAGKSKAIRYIDFAPRRGGGGLAPKPQPTAKKTVCESSSILRTPSPKVIYPPATKPNPNNPNSADNPNLILSKNHPQPLKNITKPINRTYSNHKVEGGTVGSVLNPKPVLTPAYGEIRDYGRSPFIHNPADNKRPLSNSIPDNPARRAKRVYGAEPSSSMREVKETMIISDSSDKKSLINLIFAIILVVIIGTIIGAGVYLAFFQ